MAQRELAGAGILGPDFQLQQSVLSARFGEFKRGEKAEMNMSQEQKKCQQKK